MMVITTNTTTIMTTTTTISAADKEFLRGAKGFMQRYLRNRTYYAKCQEAYEVTERQHEALTGERRYKNYDSFRSAYSAFFKKK